MSDERKSPSEEIVLPLELVINKDSKSKENRSDSSSAECGSSNVYRNDTFDNHEESYDAVTNDAVTNDNSSEVYIPRIEPYNVVLNIENHLRNDNDRDSNNPQNPYIKNVTFFILFIIMLYILFCYIIIFIQRFYPSLMNY